MIDPKQIRYGDAEIDAWHRGFIAGCALIGGHKDYYEEERDRYLAAKGWTENDT